MQVVWGLSVTRREATSFIESDPLLRDLDPELDIFVDFLPDPRGGYLNEIRCAIGGGDAQKAPEGVLVPLLIKHRADQPLIILDLAGGMGWLEFQIVRETMGDQPYLLFLDDINHIKHYRSKLVILAYVFFALYQFGEHWMYFVTGLAWIFAGLGIYSAARGLGASHTGSVVAAWLGLMSPNVLAQAASTNDEVLAATPILIGLSFGMAWLSTSRRRYAVLAGIGIGLGCGTKLHWTFYWVFVLAALILLAIRFLRKPHAWPELRCRIPDVLLAGCVALPMIGAFAVCNYISSGQVMDPRLAEVNLNYPFRLDIAREKIRINTAQLFLNPIPDLVPPVHPEQRQAAYSAFNRFFVKCCFSDLVETIKPSKSGYRFAGIAKPDGFAYTEYTVWLGFLPHLLVLACLAAVFTRRLPFASLAVLAAFFFWHATDSVQGLYIDDAAAYYSFPAVLSVAGLAPAWDLARASRRPIGRMLLAGFFVVFATHAVLGANLLALGRLRNVSFVWHKPSPPADLHALEPVVIEAIESARQIYIPYAHWEILY